MQHFFTKDRTDPQNRVPAAIAPEPPQESLPSKSHFAYTTLDQVTDIRGLPPARILCSMTGFIPVSFWLS